MILVPKEQTIEIMEGQAVDFIVPVLEDGVPVSLFGADMKFYIAPKAGYTPILTKTPSETNDIMSVSLTTAECIEIGAGDYYYAFWVSLLGESTPVAIGTLKIKNSTIGAL